MAAQTYGSTSTITAAPPRVNLLPPEIAEQAKLRKAQVAMLGTGLAAVAVVGLMYMQASAKVSSATEEKAQATAANTTLRRDLGKLQTVKDTYAEVDVANKTLAQAMHGEIRWSTYLHDLTLTIPENVWVTKFDVQMNGVTRSGSGGSDAVVDPGRGTVSIEGMAFSHDDVAAWLDSLSRQKGYSDPYFTRSESVIPEEGGRVLVEYESTAYLNDKALSNRYVKGLGR